MLIDGVSLLTTVLEAVISMHNRRYWKIPVILLVIGLSLFAIGLSIFVNFWWRQQEIRTTLGLSKEDKVALIANSAGRHILIEGKLSVSNPVHMLGSKNLGPYVIYKFDRNESRFWNSLEQATPSLLIELLDGQVQVINDDYIYRAVVARTTANPDIMYAGLKPGDQVVVIGTVVQGSAGVGIQADYVGSGPRDIYMESLNQELLILGITLYPIGWPCLLVGLLLTLLGVRYVRLYWK